ncbi:MAG TPA: hypothetical protein EYQ50_22190 [Verrucomicrobiales bacterium]|nr:hypothetical protein [Verrucomicrobiales bacterium]
MRILKSAILLVMVVMVGDLPLQAGFIEQLFYDGVFDSDGNRTVDVADLKAHAGYPNAPDDFLPLDAEAGFSTPRAQGDDFGSLIRGYIVSPVTDSVGLFVASDDGSELWISSDTDPGNLSLVAFETGCCTEVFSGARLDERSGFVDMERGKVYYFEALYQEGGDGDWMDVGWQLPGGIQEIIPTGALMPFPNGITGKPGGAPVFEAAPLDAFVNESEPATFVGHVTGDQPMEFQWTKNGVEIDGATLPWYTIPEAKLADDGAVYTLGASNSAGSAVSFGATLFVTQDFDAPELGGVRGSGRPKGIIVTFNEPVDESSATNLGNYTVSGGVTVSAASLLPGNNSVLLTTSQLDGSDVNVTVSNIKDRSQAGNTLSSATTSINFGQPGLNRLAYDAPGDNNLDEIYPTPRGMANFPGDPREDQEGSFVPFFETPNSGDIDTLPPGNPMDNYYAILFGFLLPPQTGEYRFAIASDDPGELYISTDEDPANSVLVASEPVWNGIRTFGATDRRDAANPENLSAPIMLEAGRKYYVESMFKEGLGGDNLAVAWKLPGDSTPFADGDLPIAGEFLSARLDTAQLAITQQPESVTTAELKRVVFSVAAEGSFPSAIGYQWFVNDEVIFGATSNEYVIASVSLEEDNGDVYQVEVFNSNGTFDNLLSGKATLTVDNDVDHPEIVNVEGSGSLTTATVAFDEPLDVDSAEDRTNYKIANVGTGAALSVISVSMSSSSTVMLTTALQTSGERYEITVTGVKDLAATPNATDGGTGAFTAWVESLGGIARIAWDNSGPNNLDWYPLDIRGKQGFDQIDLVVRNDSEGSFAPFFESPNSGDINSPPPGNVFDNYSTVLHGLLNPTVTGNYRFAIASDDPGELYLSTDENPGNSILIALEPTWAGVRNFGTTENRDEFAPENRSDTMFPGGIALVAGQKYYIEAIAKEGGGGDNLAVTWKLPGDDSDFTDGMLPIAGEFLSTLLPVPDEIAPPPGDATISVSVDADGNVVIEFTGSLWFSSDVEGNYSAAPGIVSPLIINPATAANARGFYQTSN